MATIVLFTGEGSRIDIMKKRVKESVENLENHEGKAVNRRKYSTIVDFDRL